MGLLSLYFLRFPFQVAWLDGVERLPFVQSLQLVLSPVVLLLGAPFLLARGGRGHAALGLAALAFVGGWALLLLYIFTGGTF